MRDHLKQTSRAVSYFFWNTRGYQRSFKYRPLNIYTEQVTGVLENKYTEIKWLTHKKRLTESRIYQSSDLTLIYQSSTKGVFRTQSNILDGVLYKYSEWLQAVDCFCKKLHFRCLTGFWMLLCSTSCNVIHRSSFLQVFLKIS